MKSTDEALQEIENLLKKVRVQDAEDRIRSLLLTMGEEELRLWAFDIKKVIEQFFPKRRRDLLVALDERLKSGTKEPEKEVKKEDNQSVKIDELSSEFAESLRSLSEKHIFQWSTFYRDNLSRFFNQFIDTALAGAPLEKVQSTVHTEISQHSLEIFQKGFQYVGGQYDSYPKYAINKSLSGLQRFLEVPVEIYSTKTTSAYSAEMARILRSVTSAFVGGILNGFSSLRLGVQTGAQILVRFPRSWAHYMVFLTTNALRDLLGTLEPGDFRSGVTASMLPLVEAVDSIGASAGDYIPLPVLGQFIWEARRFDAALKPPAQVGGSQFIEVIAFLDPAYVDLRAIQEALNRDVSLIIAPLRPDLQGILATHSRASQVLAMVSASSGTRDQIARRVVDILNYAVYRRRSMRAGSAPLTYNFAREFPIQNPYLTKYFHVYRSSVRELLRAFERRNGVRLWCSVRRSGKTTACFDLSTTTGTSIIVSQTCGSAELPDATLMYDEISQAISDGNELDREFFGVIVSRCAMNHRNAGDRYVLVLDEYETLFGRLKAAVIRNQELRYTVVQPLLALAQIKSDN